MTLIHIMMDKDKAQIAACKLLGIIHLLCKFHMLQDFDRFLSSTSSGVHGPGNRPLRHSILQNISSLQTHREELVFKAEETLLHERFTAYPAVLKYYDDNWSPIAGHWAAFGRQSVRHLRSDTNNLLERFFGKLKYTYARRKVFSR
jgi:hypothetical protein